MGRGLRHLGLGLAAGFALAACSDLMNAPSPGAPAVFAPAPLAPAAPIPRPNRPPVSPESEALAVYYRQLQQDQETRGLLRQDGGGIDTPFSADMLARNFLEIALFDEYSSDGGSFAARSSPSPLRRWNMPIRMAVSVGPSVGRSEEQQFRGMVTRFSARLSRLTGVAITGTDSAPNFTVLFLNEDERRNSEARIRAALPDIDAAALRYIVNLPRDELCVVVATFDPAGTHYAHALAIIRAEHPPLMAEACVHEELAQGMGLANDSPRARPSIFNDDEEFGFLTSQDELMLRMLYDPRLRPGMTAPEAEPIVRQIASDLVDPVT